MKNNNSLFSTKKTMFEGQAGYQIIEREYKYTLPNGRIKTIKRKWKVNPESVNRKQLLNDYFQSHAETIPTMDSITAAFKDFSNEHDGSGVSYNMFYKKYQSIYHTKKQRRQQPDQATEPEDQPRVENV